MSFLRLGRPGFGAVVDHGIIDLTAMLPGQPGCLRTAIAHGQLASAMDYVEGRVRPNFRLPMSLFCHLSPIPLRSCASG